jgi:leucyl aminopeptidase
MQNLKPLEIREAKKSANLLKVEQLGFWHSDAEAGSKIVRLVNAIEIGRIVTRDIGGSDPERMSAPNIQKYVEQIFNSTDIKVEIFSILKFRFLRLTKMVFF